MSRESREVSDVETPSALDFDSFYRREYRAVRAVAWALTGSGWVADDVTQEAFLRAHQRWNQVSA